MELDGDCRMVETCQNLLGDDRRWGRPCFDSSRIKIDMAGRRSHLGKGKLIHLVYTAT